MKQLRWIALLVCCALPLPVFAFFCPTNSRFVEEGQSTDSIVQICGQPTKITEIDNSTIISAEWTYKFTNDESVKVAKFKMEGGHIMQMVESITCKPDAVDCYPEIEQDVKIFYGCDQIMYIGNNIPFVERWCGTPETKKTLDADYDITELYYYANTTDPSTLVFRNKILVDSQ